MGKRSNYKKGRSREYGILKICKNIGALDISRSYGSHGKVDCRAVFPDKVLLIQSKARFISKKEMAGLMELAKSLTAPNIHVMLWKFVKKQWQIWDLCHWGDVITLREFKNSFGVFHKVSE